MRVERHLDLEIACAIQLCGKLGGGTRPNTILIYDYTIKYYYMMVLICVDILLICIDHIILMNEWTSISLLHLGPSKKIRISHEFVGAKYNSV